MKRAILKYFYLLILLTGEIPAQNFYSGFDISINYSYTTTAKMFLNPNAADDVIRTSYTEIEDIKSYSIELRYMIMESMALGISSEFMEATSSNDVINLGGVSVRVKNGFQFIPVEFSVYYYLPFSGDTFLFFMGGGGGIYFGKQIKSFGDADITSKLKKINAGIHVCVGMEYVVWNFVSVRGQMRFRDPEFEVENTYTNKFVHYLDKSYVLSTKPFSAKDNIDGITFTVGVVFRF